MTIRVYVRFDMSGRMGRKRAPASAVSRHMANISRGSLDLMGYRYEFMGQIPKRVWVWTTGTRLYYVLDLARNLPALRRGSSYSARVKREAQEGAADGYQEGSEGILRHRGKDYWLDVASATVAVVRRTKTRTVRDSGSMLMRFMDEYLYSRRYDSPRPVYIRYSASRSSSTHFAFRVRMSNGVMNTIRRSRAAVRREFA